MKSLLLIGISLTLITCGLPKEKKTAYSTELAIENVVFYGDTITFDKPQKVTLIPNSGQITSIDLGNGTPFGVQHVLSELITGESSELLHNVIFYEGIDGEWVDLTNKEHREPFVTNQEADWGMEASNDSGTYFKIAFTYNVTEI